MSETPTPATDPLTLLLRDHGIGAPDVMAEAIHADFVVIPRSTCAGTQYAVRWPDPGEYTVQPLGTHRSGAEWFARSVSTANPGMDVEVLSRPLLPEIPWEVDSGTAEGVSSGSVESGRQETASGTGGEIAQAGADHWTRRAPAMLRSPEGPEGEPLDTSADRRWLWRLENKLAVDGGNERNRQLGRDLRQYLEETCEHVWNDLGDLTTERHEQCLWCNGVRAVGGAA